MAIQTTYRKAQANLADLCDEVVNNLEVVIIRRPGSADVALVAADELAGLIETAHLLRSPKNARRLLAALRRAKSNKIAPKTPADVRKELKLDKE